MTLEEYQEKMAEALEKLDWHNPGDKESEAYRLLADAALNYKEIGGLDGWLKLHEQYMEGVKRL